MSYLSVRDISRKLSCCDATTYRWIKPGRLRAFRICRLLQVLINELDRFLMDADERSSTDRVLDIPTKEFVQDDGGERS